MKCFGPTFFSNEPHFEHRTKNGTANSTTKQKGSDGKLNNSSEYNHEYYMKHKEKWKEGDPDDREFDVDAAARDVIRGKYKNGAERKAALGADYEIVQKRVNELMRQQKTASNDSSKEETKEESGKLRSITEAHDDYMKKKKQGGK